MINERNTSIGDRLRALPTSAVAPYDWEEFKRRSQERNGGQWHRTAIAASFVLVLAGIAGWMRFSAGDGLEQSLEGEPVSATIGVVLPEMALEVSNETATSQWLARLPDEPAIVRVGTRRAVVDLEDHIAWIDDVLNTAQIESAQPEHIQTLQRERAQLLSSLARVRYAETLAAGR